MPAFANIREKQEHILTWAKNKINLKSSSFEEFRNLANTEWHNNERALSWPSYLQRITAIPVTNLSRIGSCIGNSLIEYSNILKKKSNEKILAIHQLPAMGRMYIRFDSMHGRVDANPTNIANKDNFGFKTMYFEKQINAVHEIYKHRAMTTGYIEKHFYKILTRLENLSLKFGVNNFYMLPTGDVQAKSLENKVLLKDFKNFRSNYSKGFEGHPIGDRFNPALCDLITSTCL